MRCGHQWPAIVIRSISIDPGMPGAAPIDVVRDGDDVAIHVLQIARDRDFLDRMDDHAPLDPEARRAARKVSGDRVDTLTQLLRDEESPAHAAQQRRQVVVAVRYHQVVASARIAGRRHAELSRRVAAEEIAAHDAVAHDVARRRRDPFGVEWRAAPRARKMRLLANRDVRREHGLAQRIEQERRAPVQRPAGHRADEESDQVRGLRRLEDHRALGCRELARIEPAHGSQSGIASHALGGLEIARRARRRVPVVALHRTVAGVADHGAIDVMVRCPVTVEEAVAVRVDEFRFVSRDRAAFRVGEPRVDRKRRAFRRLAERDRRLDIEIPRVIEIEVRDRAREPVRIGESGCAVLRRVPRDRECLRHRRLDCLGREIGSVRVAAPLPEIDGDADALVPVVGDRLDLAAAHRHALPDGLRDFGFGGGRAAGPGGRQDRFGDALEFGAGQRQAPRPGHSRYGSRGILRGAAACDLDGGSHRSPEPGSLVLAGSAAAGRPVGRDAN